MKGPYIFIGTELWPLGSKKIDDFIFTIEYNDLGKELRKVMLHLYMRTGGDIRYTVFGGLPFEKATLALKMIGESLVEGFVDTDEIRRRIWKGRHSSDE